jgi:uncharacterized membrane protein
VTEHLNRGPPTHQELHRVHNLQRSVHVKNQQKVDPKSLSDGLFHLLAADVLYNDYM